MVEINNKVRAKISDRFVKRVLVETSKYLKIKNIDISVAFINKMEMVKLNKQYRNRNEVTDVLSFFYSSELGNISGEIIICYPVVKKHAREFKHSTKREVAKLLIHGFLHLMGYDHIRKKDAKDMEKLEHKLEIRNQKL